MSLRLNLERVASHSTRWLGALCGERFPFYYVIEFPKSGGSWIADMLACYLNVPRPVRFVLPIGCSAVLHGHWSFTPGLRRVVYVHRDGRDVAISAYVRALWEARNPPYPETRRYLRKRLPSLFHPEADDLRSNLPRFLEDFSKAAVGTRLNWSQHVEEWAFRPGVVAIAYEAVLADPHAALAKALEGLGQTSICERELDASIARHSFEMRSGGRAAGVEDRDSFLRKGVAGDWRNHFTRQSGEIFQQRFGTTLTRLGYEQSSGWWRDLSSR